MELKGSRTEQNLMTAFAGESQARNKYTYFASKAKKEGYEQIAAIFQETADNEKEHAKLWFKLLHDGDVPTTVENLKTNGSKPKTAPQKDISGFSVGVSVTHPKFGQGTIVNVRGSGATTILDIAFAGFGIKQLSASLAPLEIVK